MFGWVSDMFSALHTLLMMMSCYNSSIHGCLCIYWMPGIHTSVDTFWWTLAQPKSQIFTVHPWLTFTPDNLGEDWITWMPRCVSSRKELSNSKSYNLLVLANFELIQLLGEFAVGKFGFFWLFLTKLCWHGYFKLLWAWEKAEQSYGVGSHIHLVGTVSQIARTKPYPCSLCFHLVSPWAKALM